MLTSRRLFPVLLALTLAAALLPASALAKRSVPRGFFGVFAPYQLLDHPRLMGAETKRMQDAGIESVRLPVYWSHIQLCRDCALTFSRYDGLVLSAARRGISILPTVLAAPAWATNDPPGSILRPADPEEFGRFLAGLIARYGPRGSLWRAHPGVRPLPIRTWQVWNEPDLSKYWGEVGKWPEQYVTLLKASYRAIHLADPGARVVLAGLTNFSWQDLAKIYLAGGRGYFDEVGLNSYSLLARNIERIVRYNREVMARNGDARKPVVLSEVGWPAAPRKAHPATCYFCVNTAQQTERARELIPRLARLRHALRLTGVYWLSWTSTYQGTEPFDYTGLSVQRGTRIQPRPVFWAFRKAVRRAEGRR